MKTEKIRGLVGLGHRARNIVIGSRETRQGVHRGEVRLVLLAVNGSERDRERLTRVGAENEVPVHELATREELGAWVGRGPVAVLGIRDPHLAAAVRGHLEDGPNRDGRTGGQR